MRPSDPPSPPSPRSALDSKLLIGPLLGREVRRPERPLAQDGAGLVVFPAVGVGVVGKNPVAGGLGPISLQHGEGMDKGVDGFNKRVEGLLCCAKRDNVTSNPMRYRPRKLTPSLWAPTFVVPALKVRLI